MIIVIVIVIHLVSYDAGQSGTQARACQRTLHEAGYVEIHVVHVRVDGGEGGDLLLSQNVIKVGKRLGFLEATEVSEDISSHHTALDRGSWRPNLNWLYPGSPWSRPL